MNADDLGTGARKSPIYLADFCIFAASIPMPDLQVKSEDEVDEFGNVIGSAIGISTSDGFYFGTRRLYSGLGVEFQAWQNGPIQLSVHDALGIWRSNVIAPFDGPQGVRRFAAAYLPQGIGLLGIAGRPSAISEGHILRICPIGADLGPNPGWPKLDVRTSV
jgi:hypothetical protein